MESEPKYSDKELSDFLRAAKSSQTASNPDWTIMDSAAMKMNQSRDISRAPFAISESRSFFPHTGA